MSILAFSILNAALAVSVVAGLATVMLVPLRASRFAEVQPLPAPAQRSEVAA